MINNLEWYCDRWNLKLNETKYKILIFKHGGGRRAKNEKWVYKDNEIEIVKKYTYLGVTFFTSNLSWQTHLNDKLTAAKFALININ